MDTITRGEATAQKQRVTLPISGLSCGGGGTLIVERALLKVPGVLRAYVNPCTEMAYVEFDPTLCNPYLLMAAVKKAGFKAEEFSLR
ncbi:MAG TPA: heavy metal-associated domain-containing protein [Chloroflexia bacterium]|nr:heavy metal-associated domain-containing protein [Chloroflexia bacterium]